MTKNTIVPETRLKVDRRKVADLDFRLYQEAGGQWMLVIGNGQPLLATDCEVQMWKKLLAISSQLSEIRNGLSANLSALKKEGRAARSNTQSAK
jgi:hypothetical protein